MNIEYDVIAGNDLPDVVKKVNAKLAKGWFPVDSIKSGLDQQDDVEYFQTIVKVPQNG